MNEIWRLFRANAMYMPFLPSHRQFSQSNSYRRGSSLTCCALYNRKEGADSFGSVRPPRLSRFSLQSVCCRADSLRSPTYSGQAIFPFSHPDPNHRDTWPRECLRGAKDEGEGSFEISFPDQGQSFFKIFIRLSEGDNDVVMIDTGTYFLNIGFSSTFARYLRFIQDFIASRLHRQMQMGHGCLCKRIYRFVVKSWG